MHAFFSVVLKKATEIDTHRISIFIYFCFVFKRKQMRPFIDLSLFKIIESYRVRVNLVHFTQKNNSNHYRYFISLYLKKLYGYKQNPPKKYKLKRNFFLFTN